jgi:chromate transport protein ChrA
MGIAELIAGIVAVVVLVALLYYLSSCNSTTIAWCFAHRAVIVAVMLSALWPMFWVHSRGECETKQSLICAGFVIVILILAMLAEICGSEKAMSAKGRN